MEQKESITIASEPFSLSLKRLHDPGQQSPLLQQQLALVRHRFDYIKATPLKVLTQDRGFHKTLYLEEQRQLHCLLEEARSLQTLNHIERRRLETGLFECLRTIVYDPELDYSRYELAKEIVSHRTVVCHIQIAAMNIITLMMISEGLEAIEELRLFCEELYTYFLLERPTTAACVNNRVTQSLSLHFSYMPDIVSAMMEKKLLAMSGDQLHPVEDASFLNRLVSNFRIYLAKIPRYQQLSNEHKVYEVVLFYKDLHEIDSSSIELADDVMGVILKHKQQLIDFFNQLFCHHHAKQ